MNSRQRVRLALNHQEPDRVPMDLGGTGVSTIHLESYSRLLQFLELPADGLALMSDTFRTVEISDQVRQRLGVDFVGLRPKTPRGWQNVVHSADSFSDEWGIRFQRSQDASRAFFPSGHPLADADVTAIQKYPLPDMGDPSRVEGLRDVARKLHNETDYAIIAGRIDDLAPGGGYVLGAVHVIQNDVPPENIYCLFDVGMKYGQYGAISSRTNAAAGAHGAFNAKRGGSRGNGREFAGE